MDFRLISIGMTDNFANYNRNLDSELTDVNIWWREERHDSFKGCCFSDIFLLVTGLAERGGEPLKTLVQTVSGGSAGGLDVPSALPQAVKAELVSDLGGVHGVGKILLVGEDQQNGIAELVLVEHALELFPGLDDTVTIVAVDNEDDTLGVLEVMPPQRSDLVLATNIPNGELDVLVLDSLDIETNRGDGGDNLAELELVENRSFTSSIETDHQNSHLLLPPELVEDLGKRETHVGGVVCQESLLARCGERSSEWKTRSIRLFVYEGGR
jgi:hypothetical protein